MVRISLLFTIVAVLLAYPFESAWAKDKEDNSDSVSFEFANPDLHLPGPNGYGDLDQAVKNLAGIANGYTPTDATISALKRSTSASGDPEVSYHAHKWPKDFDVVADLKSVSNTKCSETGTPGFTFAADLSQSGNPTVGWVKTITMGVCVHKNGDGSVDVHVQSFMTKGPTYDSSGLAKSHIKNFVKEQAENFWKSLIAISTPAAVAGTLGATIASTVSGAKVDCKSAGQR